MFFSLTLEVLIDCLIAGFFSYFQCCAYFLFFKVCKYHSYARIVIHVRTFYSGLEFQYVRFYMERDKLAF